VPNIPWTSDPRDAELARLKAASAFDKHNSAHHKPSYVLMALNEGEISLGKACEWLRHYFESGVEDPIVQGIVRTGGFEGVSLREMAEELARLRDEAGLYHEIVKRLKGAFIVAHLGEWTEWQAAIDLFLKSAQAQAHFAQLASERYDKLLEKDRQMLEVSGELARLKAPPDVEAWKTLVRLAYAEGGDGARNIEAITAEYNRNRLRAVRVRSLEELAREAGEALEVNAGKAEKAEAELAEERARLDWVFANLLVTSHGPIDIVSYYEDRAGIDAARAALNAATQASEEEHPGTSPERSGSGPR